jgi:hypothetical protein
MTKRPSLFAAKPAPAAPAVAPEKAAARSNARPPSREGKRVLTVYLKSEAWKQRLSVNLESPTQALGEEAINLFFEKHGLNRIA